MTKIRTKGMVYPLKKLFTFLGVCFCFWLLCFATSVYAAETYVQGENTGLTQDDEYMQVPIGFDFTYYGNTYNQLNVSTNGFVTFNENNLVTYGAHYPIPSSGGHGNYIAPFNADLVTEGGSHADGKPTVYYKTEGTAPNRKFVVQWTNMYFYDTTIQMGTFQLYLYEASNEVQFQYRSLLGGDDSFGSSATIGIENADGTKGIQYSYDSKSITEGQAIRFSFNPIAGEYTMDEHAAYEASYLIDPNAPAVPQLNAPANGEKTSVATTLIWTDADKNKSNKAELFKVYVSDEPSFDTKLVNETVTDVTYYELNELTLDHTYYWRIEAINENGSSLSDTYSFTPQNKRPVVSDSIKHGMKDTSLPFTSEDFTSYYQDGDNEALSAIQVVALPQSSQGTLEVNGVPAVVDEVVYASDLSQISFIPAPGFSGTTELAWKGFDGKEFSEASAKTKLIITSGNADLSGLSTSYGTLTPIFSRLVNTYQLQVPTGISSITVTGVVYDENATFVVGGNLALSGLPSAEILLNVGRNTIPIVVTAQDGITTNEYTIYVERLSPKKHTSSGSTTVSSPSTEASSEAKPSENSKQGLEVIVDGRVQENSAALSSEQIAGRTVTTITIDNDKVLAGLNSGKTNVLTIPYHGSSETVLGKLNGQLVKAMEGKAATIDFKTDKAVYILPASQIGIDQVNELLNAGAELKNITISIQISNSNNTDVNLLQSAAKQNGFTLLSTPVDFEVSAAYNGKSLEISHFKSFVERLIPIPDGITSSQVTTAVVLNEDGTVTPVPTRMIQRDGKYYESVKSLTNSTYAIIGHSKAFTDLDHHWSQTDINNLASRLIVNGISNNEFKPDASITRAEFTAIAVKALGLKTEKQTKTNSDLKDVNASDWFADSAQTATSYGIIQGFEDGTFRPDQKMTRQEAFVILARIMKLADPKSLPNNENITDSLSAYRDSSSLSDWAQASTAAAVNQGIIQGDQGLLLPAAELTRAQSAVLLKRVLQQAKLID